MRRATVYNCQSLWVSSMAQQICSAGKRQVSSAPCSPPTSLLGLRKHIAFCSPEGEAGGEHQTAPNNCKQS
ncbi:hypothetical protein PPACK8108_LOCUS507 [Phakopsora pachyrhizi]|uniref:Uncharacterized protein n=1 Tax=Phakopsora pachyrhizi TaxID=170000 RepID=A0AAV0AE72_PHAPC|nr:hypothetical protein PPACK8108_LOCUS507 [Phakopsora pachyrhizi]